MAVVRRQAFGPSKEESEHDYITLAEKSYLEIYNMLVSDPRYVAQNLYRAQLGKSELSGSMLSLDDDNICCLVDATIKNKVDPGQEVEASSANRSNSANSSSSANSSGNSLSSICQTDIRRLQIGSKVSQPLLASYNEQRMVIKISKIDPRIRFMSINDYSVVKQLLTQGQDETTTFGCWNPRADYLIACDNYTNDILIGKLISSIYSSPEAPGKTFNAYWAAALCQKDVGWFRKSVAITGLTMMEYADYGPINKIARNSHLWATSSSLYDQPGGMVVNEVNWRDRQYKGMRSWPVPLVNAIFMQVGAAYDFLHLTHQFTHGDAKVSNLLVSSHNTSFTYRGIKIECPVTVKIVDFSKSSISIVTDDNKVTRLFNYDKVAEAQLKIVNFQPKIQILGNRRVYRLSGVLEIVKLSKIRHGGLPFFRSFDIYTAFVSMMMLPEFLIPILSDEILKKNLWDKLWTAEQTSIMEQRLWDAALSNVEPTYSNILSILDDIYLYCDLADDLFGQTRE